MTAFLAVKNWAKFQHYKQRNPPWIRLYNELLDDYAFACLQDASKWHAVGIWLLASRFDNRIPDDPTWIAQRINARTKLDLDELLSAGFIERCNDDQGASTPLALVKQDATPETETETETETDSSGVAARKGDERVWRVFDYWVQVTGRDPARTRLTAGRRQKIAARLKSYDVDALLLACDGVMLSEHHRQKQEWLDITSFMASDEKVENHRDRALRHRTGSTSQTAMTADYLATILNMAGNGVWSGETRDAALYRTSQNFDADEWAMIVPYLDHFPWAEARAAKADKFMLRDVLKRHIARTDRERAHAA